MHESEKWTVVTTHSLRPVKASLLAGLIVLVAVIALPDRLYWPWWILIYLAMTTALSGVWVKSVEVGASDTDVTEDGIVVDPGEMGWSIGDD